MLATLKRPNSGVRISSSPPGVFARNDVPERSSRRSNGGHVRGPLQGVAPDPAPARLSQLLAARVVGVEDRRAVGKQQLREQLAFGREVGVHVAVEVEMVPSQIGEHRGPEAALLDPLQREGVGRHLEHHGVAARPAHSGQEVHEIARLGRGPGRGHRAPGDSVADGPDQPRGVARRGEDRLDQSGCGALAVGPSDPDKLQRLGGIAE